MKKITISLTGATETIAFTTAYPKEYMLSGSGSLSGNYVVQADGNQLVNTLIKFRIVGTIFLGVNTFTIFGKSINQKNLTGNSIIDLIWNGSTWDIVSIYNSSTEGKKGSTAITLTSAGGSLTLDLLNGSSRYTFLGTATLSNNYTLSATNMVDGDEVFIQHKAIITKGSYDLNYLGAILTTAQALGGNSLIYAKYNGSAWITSILSDTTNLYKVYTSSGDSTPDFLINKLDGNIFENISEVVKIKDGSIGLSSVSKEIQGFAYLDIYNDSMKALNTVFLELIPASVLPTSEYGILVTHATFQIMPNGGKYTGAGVSLQIYSDTCTTPQFQTEYFIDAESTNIALFENYFIKNHDEIQLLRNVPIKIKLSGAIDGGNDSNVTRIFLHYVVIKLA